MTAAGEPGGGVAPGATGWASSPPAASAGTLDVTPPASDTRDSPAGPGWRKDASASSAGTPAPSTPGNLPEAAARVLAEIRARDTGQLAVSEEDGRFLRVLVAASGARRALEIGGASGYSAIWIALGLRETGGRLVTIEYDPGRARELAANLRRAGLDDIVRVVQGDAFVHVPALEGGFDFVFLDAWKKDYKRFYDLVEPRLEPGGLLVAHNVVNKRSELEDFLAAVASNRRLLTTVVKPSGEGMSVSVRRR
jgi:predicted O-methyltransferase YrrM